MTKPILKISYAKRMSLKKMFERVGSLTLGKAFNEHVVCAVRKVKVTTVQS